jgi:ankyrin repeat protein
LLIAVGVPALLFLGLALLPIFVRGNQDLYDAIERGDRQQVQELLRQGADPQSTWRGLQLLNARDQDRRRRFDAPPLIRALELQQPEIAAVLIEHGADVNARDAAGTPTLMLAARQGWTALVQLLLDRGADVQAADRNGDTILRSKADGEHGQTALSPAMRALLLKAGAQE